MVNVAANLIFYNALGYEHYGMNPAFREAYAQPKENGLNQFILRCIILAISTDGTIPTKENLATIIYEILTNTEVDMIRNHAEKCGNSIPYAVAHIAGFTDYCSKCGRWNITNVQVIHVCDKKA